MKTKDRATPLLAKSVAPNGKAITVAGHTQDVMNAAAALFGAPGAPSPMAIKWCAYFLIEPSAVTTFIANLRLAAFCHDWGKANDGYQQMLSHQGDQLLRHEQVSAIIICWPSVWEWLSASELDMPVVLSAVIGHHLKCGDVDLGHPGAEANQILRLRWDDREFQDFLASVAPSIGLPTPVPADVPKVCAFGGDRGAADLYEMLDAVRDRLEPFDRAIRPDKPESEPRRRMLWAVRAAVIAADAAGSGLVRTARGVGEWIGAAFDPSDRLTSAFIEERVVRCRLNGKRLYPFQEAAGDPHQLPARSLLMAPCGFGKTLAAWRWIAARLNERPRGRAIFLYPTRGTATEGYRDYAGLVGEEVAALMHGTADLDLDGIEGDISTERRINEARLFALRQWPKRVFSATVDQFLGFMQYNYGATCQLPLLADSVVVLDEIHSYDRGMWSALTEFLRAFPSIPVLCMTATLLSRRINDLRAIGLRAVNGVEMDGGDGSELGRAARHGRYRMRCAADQAEASEAADAALARGHRVLWVVNTVDRCQAIVRQFANDPDAESLQTRDGLPLFCYHSRYKLGDRKQWHEAVVGAFKPGSAAGGVLAVTTQVCEMSLDLDADVLITEHCPATALVQRMGRCCRDPRAHMSGRTGEVVIYAPEKILPYTKSDLEGVDDVIDAMMVTKAVSQERLAELLESVSPPVEMPKACRFTESGVWAASGEEQFRDSDDISRPAVLADDVDEFARLRDPKRRGDDPPWKADALVMNVPKNLTQEHGRCDLPQWLRMAKGGTYRPSLGYCGGEVATYKLV